MSIILAAMAPVMTTRMSSNKSAENTSPWKWVTDRKNLDAYLKGNFENNRAIIGQNQISVDGTENARLILNTSDAIKNHIIFKNKGTKAATLWVDGERQSITLGSEMPDFVDGTGLGITAFGYGALESLKYNVNALANTAIGFGAMANFIHGADNVAVGRGALTGSVTNPPDRNPNGTGNNNTAVGSFASYNNSNGSDNVAVGFDSLVNNKTGSNNVAIGYGACQYVEGSNKICIGKNSGPDENHAWATDDDERIFIGSKSKFNDGTAVLEVHNDGQDIKLHNNQYKSKDSSVVINGNLIVKGTIISHVVDRVGNNVSDFRYLERSGEDETNASLKGSLTELSGFEKYFESPTGVGTGWTSSDRRLKNVGKEFTSGLDKIKQIKTFNYTFKKDKEKTPRVGVIAQDLQKVFPDAVKKDSNGFLLIRQEDMFYAVINAIKELDAKITALINKETAKDRKIKELEKRIEALEKKLK